MSLIKFFSILTWTSKINPIWTDKQWKNWIILIYLFTISIYVQFDLFFYHSSIVVVRAASSPETNMYVVLFIRFGLIQIVLVSFIGLFWTNLYWWYESLWVLKGRGRNRMKTLKKSTKLFIKIFIKNSIYARLKSKTKNLKDNSNVKIFQICFSNHC